MAPGSRGVGAVFVCFSGEDSGQTGDAFGEPRVPRRSRSRYLSNAPGLADQLVASQERLCARRRLSGRKNAFYSQRVFSQILSQFARVFDLAPDVGFRRSWYRRKACAAYFCKVPDFAGIRAWTCEIWSREQRPPGCFWSVWRTFFRSGFRLDPVNSWRSESSTSCMNVSSFQRARACGSTCCESGRLCAQAWQRRWENSGIFSTALFRRPVFTCVVDVAPDIGFRRSWYRRKACATYFPKVQALHRGELGFDHNSLVSRPFLARKAPNRSSHHALQNGQGSGQFDSAFGLVNGSVKPWSNLVNLGQTWSNLVKALQNSGKCVPDHILRVFWDMVDPSRVGNGSVKPRSNLGQPWSNLVNPSQTWSNFGKCVPDLLLGSYLMWRALVGSGRLGSGCLVLRADTRENPVGKNGVMTLAVS
uniref:Uncharacterized protein n=1 Tax=Fagus sylvatica TaxID=28930 RepID=A0A2N9ETI7_FAGSY